MTFFALAIHDPLGNRCICHGCNAYEYGKSWLTGPCDIVLI